MKLTRILLCQDSLEGILSAVHEAYVSRYGLHDIRIELMGQPAQTEMFSEYREVVTDTSAAAKVALAVRKKISKRAFDMIFNASCADNPKKAHAIYRFIVGGFYMGAQIENYLSEPSVQLVMQLSRQVSKEADQLFGFLRFEDIGGKLLLARIRPRHWLLYQLADHFTERFPKERFIICDVGRKRACLHIPGKPVRMFDYSGMEEQDGENMPMIDAIRAAAAGAGRGGAQMPSVKDDYETLWKAFFRTIMIKERENPRCQMNMMPKRYWDYMPEMEGKK